MADIEVTDAMIEAFRLWFEASIGWVERELSDQDIIVCYRRMRALEPCPSHEWQAADEMLGAICTKCGIPLNGLCSATYVPCPGPSNIEENVEDVEVGPSGWGFDVVAAKG